MLHVTHLSAAWSAAARSAIVDRWTLLSNHVLRSEPRATERLAAHAGRIVALAPPDLWSPPRPSWLGAGVGEAADVAWRITKAGLLERVTDPVAGDPPAPPAPLPDARIGWQATSFLAAARALATGDAGAFEVQAPLAEPADPGREALVADIRWVLDNVRWDVAGDVSRVVPPPLQGPAVQVAEALGRGLRRGARAVDAWWPKT